MNGNVTGSRGFFREIFSRVRSTWTACTTALPYLFSSGDLHKEVTEQYPDPISSKTHEDLPPRTRGLLFNDIEKCTGCRACEKICPTDCFRIETEPGADATKTWVAQFDIDFSRCIFCGLCVESCIPQSLVHTKQYEGAVYSLGGMTAKFGRGYVTPQQRAKWASMRKALQEEDMGP